MNVSVLVCALSEAAKGERGRDVHKHTNTCHSSGLMLARYRPFRRAATPAFLRASCGADRLQDTAELQVLRARHSCGDGQWGRVVENLKIPSSSTQRYCARTRLFPTRWVRFLVSRVVRRRRSASARWQRPRPTRNESDWPRCYRCLLRNDYGTVTNGNCAEASLRSW